jgi:hypothetical protein
MTLIKSLLLGSAAGLVAVSAAQAADLPTRKGPVAAEYVRICSITVAGAPVVGFVLPGSDTCLKISGYITGQIEGGNVSDGRFVHTAFRDTAPAGNPNPTNGFVNDYVNAGGPAAQDASNSRARSSFGYTTRFNLTFDAVSNTAYGPLVAHGELQFNHGEGFDNTGRGGSDGGLNRAYVTWAGLTAGKIDSFFSFTGGGLAWANFFSADRKGFDQPDVLAYTASFGGGFSATLSAESPAWLEDQGAVVGGNAFLGSATRDGIRFPDIVGALDVKQAWGAAHIAGVAHNVRATSTYATLNGVTSTDTWGYAIDAGVSFNIPNMAGSVIGVTGSWSRNAIVYSGLIDGMWGEEGAVNGNGQAMAVADTFANNNGGWAVPEAWSVTGWAQFAVNPQVTLGLEGSYGELRWNNTDAVTTLSSSRSFIVGGVAHYDPVKNLDFEFELLYQNTQTARPTAIVGPWNGNADGFAARFEVTRSF